MILRKINFHAIGTRILVLHQNVIGSLPSFNKKTYYSTESGSNNETLATAENAAPEMKQSKNISKAMKAYLERAHEHAVFMEQQTVEYKIGKRHLANMMGEDPETFTQEDVDKAIEYLFPSGLFDPKARPFMKPPEEVFPARKAAEFDELGRPHSSLFYTGRANFYTLLYDVVENMEEINRFEDAMNKKGIKPDPSLAIETIGYQWTSKEELEKQLMETITDKEYDSFIASMERMVSLPYSYKKKEFIMQYKKPLLNQTKSLEIPKLKYDADGRAYVTTYECLRKRARGHVTVRSPGTGKILVNDKDIQYFHDVQSREQMETLVKCGFTLNFHWAKSHVGIGPNERVDLLAKRACVEGLMYDNMILDTDFLSIVKRNKSQ